MLPSSLSDWGLRLIAANDFGGCGGAGSWVGCRKRLKGPEIGVSWGPVLRAGAPQPCQAGTRANIRLMFQAMVTRLHSPRAPDQITHSLADIIRFRLLMIAADLEGRDLDGLRRQWRAHLGGEASAGARAANGALLAACRTGGCG